MSSKTGASGQQPPIRPGSVLGPYEVRSVLGVGGMGEVFRAHDARVGRDVAIKILPQGLFLDKARRERFAMEARATGALNHPNIVSLFDVNLDHDPPYIVSELVEGQSMRSLLQRGPVPVRQLLDIAVQVADGLSAAHRMRFVHRDLKPENVILTPDGRPKILDFGLAKQMPNPIVGSGEQATMVASPTIEGTVVGTVHYMSPEQARGRVMDTRSDVFSMGIILYEMAVGQYPFPRESSAEVLNAIINDEPPEMGAAIPATLRWTIQRCLAKDPDERYHSTRDLWLDLRLQRERLAEMTSISMAAVSGVAPAPVSTSAKRGKLWLAGLGGLVLGLAAMGLMSSEPKEGISARQFRPLATSGAYEDGAAWSPDGKSIAYHVAVNGVSQIFTQSLDSPTPTQVTHGPEQCKTPVWSQDGERLYFLRNNDVASIGAAGGEPQLVMRDAFAFSVSQAGDKLAVVRRKTNPLAFEVWISSPVGAPPVRYKNEPYANSVVGFNRALVSFSPDGKKLLFWAPYTSANASSDYWLLPIPAESGTPKKVLESLGNYIRMGGVSWMPDSRRVVVAYTDAADSFRAHIYLADTSTGKASPLISSIEAEGWPQVSRDGTKLAYTSIRNDTDLVEIPLDGSPVRDLIATSRMERSAHWSRERKELTYVSDRGGNDEIWVKTMEQGWEKPLVPSRDKAELLDSPSFSPDGSRVAFVRTGRNGPEIWIAPVAGGAPVRLMTVNEPQLAPTWSPDSRYIAYFSRGSKGGLKKMMVGSTAAPVLLHETVGMCTVCVPEWSPKGDWIAYSDAEGTLLVSPDGGKERVLRKPPFTAVAWSADAATLYGLQEEGTVQKLIGVEVSTGKERVLNQIEARVRIRSLLTPGLRLSVSPDGKSIAATSRTETGDIWMVEDFEGRKSGGMLSGLFSR
ncbi:MAG: protein kinase [Bryobacteraceae bacterium]